MDKSTKKGPLISVVAAIGAYNREVGNKNKLIWHIPDDLKRFKKITEGHPVIMGRKTFDSIVDYLKKPLPKRVNIVVTRDAKYSYSHSDVVIASSFEGAVKRAKEIDGQEVFIGGGSNLWEQAFPFVDKLYLTLIYDRKDADTFFPEYKNIFTKKTFEENRETKEGLKYTWVNLEK